MSATTEFIAVTLFDETREIEFFIYSEDRERLTSKGLPVVGRFPTGTKLHQSSLTLWKRHQERGGKVYSSRGATAAVVNGEEYVADTTLYTHNSNRGRITGWYEAAQAPVIAQW